MDNIDRIIENTISKQIYEPEAYKQAILTAFDNKKRVKIHSNIILKVITTIIAFVTMATGIVFAKDISKFILNIFDPNTTSQGIIKMSEEGYLYNTQMDYSESNGEFIKVNDVIMDDYNLDIVFDLKLRDETKRISKINISDMLITDENKNIIFCDNSEIYEKFCRENAIKYSNINMSNNYTNNGYSVEIIEQTDKSIKFIYKMYAEQYPKSKVLSIKLNKIDIVMENKTTMNIEGKWNLQLDLPEAFYNRQILIYKSKDDSDKKNNVEIKSAQASNTEMKIEMKIYKEMTNDDRIETNMELIDEKIGNIIEGKEIIKTITLINESGEIFTPVISSREGTTSTIYRSDGSTEITIIFPITRSELSNLLKLKIQFADRIIEIELNR